MPKCIVAWTATDGYRYYPQFVSVNVLPSGAVEITVRGPEDDSTPGEHAAMQLPYDEFVALAQGMVAYAAQRNRAAKATGPEPVTA